MVQLGGMIRAHRGRRTDSPMNSFMLSIARWVESLTANVHSVSERAVVQLAQRHAPHSPITKEWIEETREHMLLGKSDSLDVEDLRKRLSEHRV